MTGMVDLFIYYLMGKKVNNKIPGEKQQKTVGAASKPEVPIKNKRISKKQTLISQKEETNVNDPAHSQVIPSPIKMDHNLNKDLECPICLDLFICPVKLSCDHAFCMPCMDRMASYDQINKKCSICRKIIADSPNQIEINLELNKQMKQFQNERMQQEEKEVYNKRVNNYQKQVQKWKILPEYLKAHLALDIRIGNNWKRGKILDRFSQQKGEILIIQNESSKEIYLMPVANDCNMAKYRFHTQKLFDTPEQFIHEGRLSVSRQPMRNVLQINPFRSLEPFGIQSIWRRLDSQSTILPISIEEIDQFM